MKTDTAAMIEELRAHGYTEAQIKREVRYVERVARETEMIRRDREWNFGLHHAA